MQDLEAVSATLDPEHMRQTIARLAEIFEQFGEAVRRTLEALAQAARLAVAAIVDWCRRISRLVAIQRLVPTPWHYKRARVELRRAGQPVTGQAVLTLACQLRMSTDG